MRAYPSGEKTYAHIHICRNYDIPGVGAIVAIPYHESMRTMESAVIRSVPQLHMCSVSGSPLVARLKPLAY